MVVGHVQLGFDCQPQKVQHSKFTTLNVQRTASLQNIMFTRFLLHYIYRREYLFGVLNLTSVSGLLSLQISNCADDQGILFLHLNQPGVINKCQASIRGI